MRADCLPHASVIVSVNDKILTEHSTENDALSVTTFVEAVAGAHFAVVLQLHDAFAYRHPSDRIHFAVHLDGEYAAAYIVNPSTQSPVKSTINSTVETIHNQTTRRNFIFASHETTEDQAHAPLADKFAAIGEITVKLIRCRHDGYYRPGHNHYLGFTGVGDTNIPEKALKGRSISNHVKLGPVQAAPQLVYGKCTYPYGTHPIATYTFQYRSRRDLEIEGILERHPSPVPLVDRNPDELTPDELREQVHLLRAKHAAVEIKQENMPQKRARARSATLDHDDEDDDDDDEGDVTITSTSDRRKRARAGMEGAETIDLTED